MTHTSPPLTKPSEPITLLMATYNGAQFIDAQLQSIAAQTHLNWSLWVSDDGSCDKTVKIVATFAKRHPKRSIRIFEGPKSGPAQNFLSLLAHPDLPKGSIAFADQDDVWLPHKLARAVEALAAVPNGEPAGYVCLDIATDAALQPYTNQKRRIKFASFQNALVQNVMRGNAIMLNNEAVQAVRSALVAAQGAKGIKFHDWWVYLVLTGIGARVIIDQVPRLYYRQHGENVLGANVGFAGLRKRLKLLGSRQHQDWITCNLTALEGITSRLTLNNQHSLRHFICARQSVGPSAWYRFMRSGARWQTSTGTAVMAIQALLGRI